MTIVRFLGQPLFIALLFIGLVEFSHANTENLVTSENAVGFANRMMIDISRGKTQQVWRTIKANSIIPPERVDAFAANYQQHMSQTIQFWGQPLGVELVAQEAFGRSLLRVTYLMKYNVSGIAWYFYFYRLKDRWIVSEFNFDLNTNSLFQTVKNTSDANVNSMTFLAWQEVVDKKLSILEQNLNVSPPLAAAASPAPVAAPEAVAPVAPTAPVAPDPTLVEFGARLAALEAREIPSVPMLVIANDTRITALESKLDQQLQADAQSAPAPTPPVPISEPVSAGISSQSEAVLALQSRVKQLEAQVAAFESATSRLQKLSDKMNSLDTTLNTIANDVDLKELARIGVTIEALKKQHPYLEIPGEPKE